MAKIITSDKATGDQHTAAEYNAFKAAINSLHDGTNQNTYNIGEAETLGLFRLLKALGVEANIDLILTPKGTGKLKVTGAAYPTDSERVLVLSPSGEILGTYETQPEQVAVPANLMAPGIPGSWAADPGNLYFCTGPNSWLQIPSVSEALGQLEMYLSIPVSATAPGQRGQKAFDSVNNVMYECIALNTWIKYNTLAF